MKKLISMLTAISLMGAVMPLGTYAEEFTVTTDSDAAESASEPVKLYAPDEEFLYAGSMFYLRCDMDGYYNTAYYSSDESIATVEGGLVTIKSKGTVDITVEISAIEGIPESADYYSSTEEASIIGEASITLDITHESMFSIPTSEGLTYEVQSDGTAIITGYEGDGIYVDIPSEIDGYKVSGVQENLFSPDNNLNYQIGFADISAEISEIPARAFARCVNLKKADIPSGIESIGSYAFYNCRLLNSVEIPDTAASVANHAFAMCGSLESLTIPDSVTEIGDYAFSQCTNLSHIELPEKLTAIEPGLLSDCRNLTEIVIPDGVTSIGSYAFSSCEKLVSAVFPSDLVTIEGRAFSNCSALEAADLSEGVTLIGDYAFSSCTGLKSAVIPDSVTALPTGLFYGCSALENVQLSASVTDTGYRTFENCSSLESVIIPENVTEIGTYTFYGCTNLKNVDMPYGTVRINNYAFCNCSSLEQIDLPEGLEYIGASSFYGCSALSSIELPESITEVSDRAFSGCTSLASINFPKNMKKIALRCFYGCTALTSVTIPEYIAEIKNYAFFGCENLKTVIIENPECIINEPDPNIVSNDGEFTFTGTVYGYKDSTAQTIAEKYGYPFVTFEEEAVVFGDASCDGEVLVNDVVLVLSYATKQETSVLSKRGLENADVYQSGDGVAVTDAAAIQKYLTKIIDTLPES